jgi:hypothetical protein
MISRCCMNGTTQAPQRTRHHHVFNEHVLGTVRKARAVATAGLHSDGVVVVEDTAVVNPNVTAAGVDAVCVQVLGCAINSVTRRSGGESGV